MSAAKPKPKSHGKQWGKAPDKAFKPKPPKLSPGEPKTAEGRARKKMQFGLLYDMGCVLTKDEMNHILSQLPEGWVEKECD